MIKLYIFESVADALAFEHPAPQTEPKRDAIPEVTGGAYRNLPSWRSPCAITRSVKR